MLVLSRRRDECVVISTSGSHHSEASPEQTDIVVTVLGVDKQGQVKLGIEAPANVRIMRSELLAAVQADNQAALLPSDMTAVSLPSWPNAPAGSLIPHASDTPMPLPQLQAESEDHSGTEPR